MRAADAACSPLHSRSRRAFTLLEMLVTMAAMGTLMALLAVTMLGIVRVEGGSRAALDRISIYARLADQFRNDVAQAEAAPERWQTQAAGSSCLILRMAGGEHVVYRCETNQLLRLQFTSSAKPIRTVLLAPGRGDVAFRRSDPDGRLLTLRCIEIRPQRDKKPATHTLLEVAAALGGAHR
jgi:prepilin-type N-terminal cleavage/methylation domain-containing protein